MGQSLERLKAGIEQLAERVPVVISTPALPPAPVSFAPPQLADVAFWEMESAIASWALRLAANDRVRILNARWLDGVSAPSSRADYKSDLATGFPYQVGHADVLASSLVALLAPAVPAKGLITDLDDTFWLGLVGEVGVEGVHWTLDEKAQVHGLYQQLLQSLLDSGVLVGVASKNEANLVAQAFERKDLLVDTKSLFPVHVNWGPKSKSVEKILAAWNIGADSVVFIDDSPMEVAEVMAAFPQIQGIVFPKNDPAAVVALLSDLRRRFGKTTISEEDALRVRSLRASPGAEHDEARVPGASLDEFLQSADAVIRIDCTNPPRDSRALELVNKTNQFNLNGTRYTEAEWQAELQRDGSLLSVVSYEDRFGPLGRIAVFSGVVAGGDLTLKTWVMSCRAFSRRIEHACLKYLLDQPGIERVIFDFKPTPRNGPLQEFLREVLGEDPTPAAPSLATITSRAAPSFITSWWKTRARRVSPQDPNELERHRQPPAALLPGSVCDSHRRRDPSVQPRRHGSMGLAGVDRARSNDRRRVRHRGRFVFAGPARIV